MDSNAVIMWLPSSGGIGNKLNTPSITLTHAVADKICINVLTTEGLNNAIGRYLIHTKQANANTKLENGPARAATIEYNRGNLKLR